MNIKNDIYPAKQDLYKFYEMADPVEQKLYMFDSRKWFSFFILLVLASLNWFFAWIGIFTIYGWFFQR